MKKQENDELAKVEAIIGQILRIGVIMSASIIGFGLLLLVFMQKTGYAENIYPTDFRTIVQGLFALKPYAIMMTGLFLLILTPVLRVLVSIYAFYKEKDYLYVWITSFVLIILIVAMLIGYYNK